MKKPSNPSTGARLLRVPLTRLEPKQDSITVRPRIATINGCFARHPLRAPEMELSLTTSKTKFAFDEAVDVWLRHFSGQYQHQIAAAYVINGRAVNHVLKEKTHVGSKQIAEARFNKSA
jgi:hypothetical protein